MGTKMTGTTNGRDSQLNGVSGNSANVTAYQPDTGVASNVRGTVGHRGAYYTQIDTQNGRHSVPNSEIDKMRR